MIEPGASYLIESDSRHHQPVRQRRPSSMPARSARRAAPAPRRLDIDGSLTNTGTIEADSGTLDLDATSFTQVSGSTLTGGTWNALDGAASNSPAARPSPAMRPPSRLGGAGATIAGLAGLASNSGSFEPHQRGRLHHGRRLHQQRQPDRRRRQHASPLPATSPRPPRTLDDQIGGTPASGQFGQLAVTRRGHLAGTSTSAWSMASARIRPGLSGDVVASATGNFASLGPEPRLHRVAQAPASLDLDDRHGRTVDLR